MYYHLKDFQKIPSDSSYLSVHIHFSKYYMMYMNKLSP